MNQKRWVRLLLLVGFVSLTACNREPQPSASPVGRWAGTLTMVTGGSGTQPFTATISKSSSEERGGFIGLFMIEDEVYKVLGGNRSITGESEIFTFSISIEELRPALSPVEFYGLMWSGPMTETTYSGSWSFNSESNYRSGEFVLERIP